jgi:hypothetical protein
MKIFLLAGFVFVGIYSLSGQVTMSNGEHVMEISGSISTYYNHRVLKPDSDNRNKDRFRLRDAQLQIEGRVRNDIEYELQVDMVDLASYASGLVDPENPGLMDAYVIYKGWRWMDIQLGYGKLYYGRSSMVPFQFSPYWQRAQIARGDFFSRRDVGLTLMKSMWRQRLHMYGGMYTGLGELSLRGDNDASGQPEYVGRIEIAYPSRYRYREIDDRISPTPMFQLGVNGRYVDKSLPVGRRFPTFSEGEFGLKVVDGQKTTMGLDASFQYLGWSAQFEIHQLIMRPQKENNALMQGYTFDETGGYVRAGGWVLQIHYFYKPMKLILSARYETLNISDLAAGVSHRMGMAAAYQIKSFDAMIKFQYFNILREESIDPIRWTEQFRLGLQYSFK